ncbi:MAG: four helix bundle protein, partial [Syntrophobacteria bacterium]
MKKQTYDLEERLLEYSVRIIKIVEQLPNTRAGNHVAGQLLRSGTSPYPNHGEAQVAESPKDFIHKLRISLKELRESQRWLTRIFHELVPRDRGEGCATGQPQGIGTEAYLNS